MVEAQCLVELNEGLIQKYGVSLVLDIHLPGVFPKRAPTECETISSCVSFFYLQGSDSYEPYSCRPSACDWVRSMEQICHWSFSWSQGLCEDSLGNECLWPHPHTSGMNSLVKPVSARSGADTRPLFKALKGSLLDINPCQRLRTPGVGIGGRGYLRKSCYHCPAASNHPGSM